MRIVVFSALLVVCGLTSQGIASGRLNADETETIRWAQNINELFRSTEELSAKEKHGNFMTASLTNPFSRLLEPLTSFLRSFSIRNYESYIQFHLYTRQNTNESQILYKDNATSVEQSNYETERTTVVIVHGYLNDINSPMVQLVKNRFLDRFDYNVIGVDWSGIIEREWFYWQVANDAEPVGRHVGDFLSYLIQNQYMNISNLYMVGHSLGAHVAGFAGKQIKSLTNETVPRISGLDPALPGFKNKTPNLRLALTDAKFVDCIHTCGGYLAYSSPICHADFYPNGGFLQPGCSLLSDIVGTCSHSRAYEYYAESIEEGHYFISYKCVRLPEFKNPVLCNKTDALMGYPAQLRDHGVYYLKTNSEYSYSSTVIDDGS